MENLDTREIERQRHEEREKMIVSNIKYRQDLKEQLQTAQKEFSEIMAEVDVLMKKAETKTAEIDHIRNLINTL